MHEKGQKREHQKGKVNSIKCISFKKVPTDWLVERCRYEWIEKEDKKVEVVRIRL